MGILVSIAISFIVKSDGINTLDIFNLVIPHPPVWTSYIPYLGTVLDYIFELFSLHGIVQVVLAVILFGLGSFLYKKSE